MRLLTGALSLIVALVLIQVTAAATTLTAHPGDTVAVDAADGPITIEVSAYRDDLCPGQQCALAAREQFRTFRGLDVISGLSDDPRDSSLFRLTFSCAANAACAITGQGTFNPGPHHYAPPGAGAEVYNINTEEQYRNFLNGVKNADGSWTWTFVIRIGFSTDFLTIKLTARPPGSRPEGGPPTSLEEWQDRPVEPQHAAAAGNHAPAGEVYIETTRTVCRTREAQPERTVVATDGRVITIPAMAAREVCTTQTGYTHPIPSRFASDLMYDCGTETGCTTRLIASIPE